MKSIYKFFLLTIIGIGTGSCSLEEEPYGFLSTQNFYQTESDALAALAYAYDALPTVEYYGRYMYYVGTLGSEELTLKADAQVADHELDNWNTIPSNIVLGGVFFNAYMGINRCNLALANIDESIEMAESVRNQILGELYFLRALHYFNLVRTFGEVPIRTEPVLNADAIPKAVSSLEEIYALIESDLKFAEESMNEVLRDGRANKIAAQALLSKVYLFQASAKATGVNKYDYVPSAEEYYQEAENYALLVLSNNSGYSFWTGTYANLWDVENQVGNEFIFSIGAHIEGGLTEGDWTNLSMLQVPYLGGTTIALEPDFEVMIPDGWNHLITEIPFYESFDDSDLRKTNLIVDDVMVGSEVYSYPGNLAYPFTRKYIDKNQIGDRTGHYLPVIRFTDIALVYAEAAGATPEAYSWVNQIRQRAGLTDLSPGLSDAEFREAVFQERTFEMAFEGERVFDLRRTNKVEEVLEGQYGKTVGESAIFYAIPQNEKDSNPLIN